MIIEKEFPYETHSYFVDNDGIMCVFTEDVMKLYPGIEKVWVYYAGSKRLFDSLTWNGDEYSTAGEKFKELNVITVSDLMMFINKYHLYKEIEKNADNKIDY